MTDTVIFDLDGTLLNTLDDLHASVNYALAYYGLPLRTRQEIRRFLGNGIRVLVESSVPEGTDEVVFNHVFNCFRRYYLNHSLDKTAPYNGIIPMLEKCKILGYKTAIVSNKLDPAVKDLYNRFFSDVIDVALGETTGICRKPAPDMVYKALDTLESTVDSSVYVGDSEVDMETAQRANMRCISVSWGFRDKKFLMETGSNTIIDYPEELFEHL